MEGSCEFGIQRLKKEVAINEFAHLYYAWLCVQQPPKGRNYATTQIRAASP